MSCYTDYTEGQIHQLATALEAEGFTSADLDEIKKNLPRIREFLRGTHELRLMRHIIDCDADPYCPTGWEVVEHRKCGRIELEWNQDRIRLYLSKDQEGGSHVSGHKLRKELADQPILNANVLDYLLAHSELIPKEWEEEIIFFWGTIYRFSDSDGDSDDNLFVRHLRRIGGGWVWDYSCLADDFGDNLPAAVLSH